MLSPCLEDVSSICDVAKNRYNEPASGPPWDLIGMVAALNRPPLPPLGHQTPHENHFWKKSSPTLVVPPFTL